MQWFLDLIDVHDLREFLIFCGKVIGPVLGALALGYLAYLQHMYKRFYGDSDEVLNQANYLCPIEDGKFVLLIRTVGLVKTINALFDNRVLRKTAARLANKTSATDPILRIQSKDDVEVSTTILNVLSGFCSIAAHAPAKWLMVLTSEDRAFVAKRCIRNFLVLEQDLIRFADWTWVVENVRVEYPSHYFRLVALHKIALEWQQMKARAAAPAKKGVADSRTREAECIREVSLRLPTVDVPIRTPIAPNWTGLIPDLKRMGFDLV